MFSLKQLLIIEQKENLYYYKSQYNILAEFTDARVVALKVVQSDRDDIKDSLTSTSKIHKN